MPQTIPTNITNEIVKESLTAYELFIIVLDDVTLHFTSHDQIINFFDLNGAATEYLPVAISRGDMNFDMETLISSVSITLDNINRAISSYVADNEFRGRRVVVRKVFEDYLTVSTDFVTIFDGLISKPKLTEQHVMVDCVSRGGTLNLQTPRRMYSVLCNWNFGSDECGFDIEGTKGTGVADALTTSTRLEDAARGEADHHWKYGEITITSGTSTGQSRRIAISSGTTLTMDYAFASGLTAGDHYEVRRGCSKAYLWCSGLGNLVNYGGFNTIPQLLVIR